MPLSESRNAGIPNLAPLTQGQTGIFNVQAAPFNAVGDGVTDDTAAIQAAMNAASAAGGGIVVIPPRTFKVSQLTFAGLSNVMLVGQSVGFSYGNPKTNSTLLVTSGVWGIRFTADSSYNGMDSINLTSNGALSFTAPHNVVTPGVEYGVLIETGSTYMRACTIFGFQYGVTIASGGNSNVFEQVSGMWCTKAGFVCTFGSAACYAAYHPNLVPPVTPLATTVYTIRDCNFRRNAWGMIMRDGGPNLDGTNVVEANFFGGLIMAVGSLDSGVSMIGRIYLEANWLLYDTNAAYTITQNNCLKDGAATWLPWTTNANTALNDAGYQLYAMTDPTHNGVNDGPGYVDLVEPSLVCGSAGVTPGKGVYLKQASFWRIFNGGCTGGDQPNAVRVGATGFSVNACHFWDWNGTLPALSGTGQNRNASFIRDRTGPGGIIATQGQFQNVGGTVAGTIGTFSGTLGVTGILTVNGVSRALGVGGALATAAAWRFADTNSGSSRDWAIANGVSATGVSQIGALTFSQSTALSGDPLAAGTEIARLDGNGLQITTGDLRFTTAISRIRPGATSLSFRNNANSADNLIITDAGAATFRLGITHGSAVLLTTTVALTNNAAAAAATLTNGPTAGNPTKWIPINDNGTTRNIPAW